MKVNKYMKDNNIIHEVEINNIEELLKIILNVSKSIFDINKDFINSFNEYSNIDLKKEIWNVNIRK